MPQASCDEGTRKTCPTTHVLPDPLFILLVGEGNLSFTYALVKRLSRSAVVRRATQNDAVAGERQRGIVVEVIATTFDSEAEVSRKYPEAVGFLAYFAAKRRVRVRYHDHVNATSLSSAAAPLRDQPLHLLIFNNPHIGFEDLYRQIALLSHFFRSARELHTHALTQDFPQEVVVTLCDDQAQRWDLLGCAARSGYICVAAVPMRSADFPEYTNRRHQRHAAFPFRIMVQYYFVAPQAALHGVLRDLSEEMMSWEQERQARLHEGLPCSYTCVEWLRVAKSNFGYSSQAADATAEVIHSAATHPSVLSGDDFSVNRSACSAQQPLPLLHPTLVARVVGEAAMAPFSSAPSEDHTEAFMPYLPSSTWIRLYRAQRWAEQRCSFSVALAPPKTPPLPPHLDSSILGRPLTSKEASKLGRYLSGYGAAMRAKAQQRRQAEMLEACPWSCKACQPARTFEREDDLRQHQIAKHCGATPLAPTLYARVHEQVEAASRRLEEALAGLDIEDGGDKGSCEVCGLRFKSSDAYEEHLRYLSPLPVDDAADLVCNVCHPVKCFTDRRALEQHRATKHSAAE
ncbi:Domain of unknown function (DUF2431) [Leishmania donovani]|uniref:C2H2-type domain-containing protein n=1 Tax=Leishmania donovani TaxID=5661 RepID=A0A3Q8ID26_LEIDO|nr:hypothetical protein, unknown function [Leishmania donovani]AYU79331.1 protein of unknown function (DUF2431), putative [Leishmania donovani]TPP49025.1 hypothetical protein CGC20_27220 [Leishmania donovani]CAJ1989323.1 Domain of unknown function (DUF2431) [Leishmania donovani]CBZ34633.1 hypothetical protein, unknown function [Leishmania donovani]VDZ45190.1 Domain_of_unknown_function_(DUF2431)_putative/Pfam:PF10354 [Leishmania donovani]